jgi:replicative DNA helicase
VNGEAPDNNATQAGADAERALLAALLLSPAEIADVAPLVTPDDFASASNRDLYAAMLDADAARDTLEVVTLGERLAGNARALASLHQAAVEAPMGKATRYAGLVRDASLRRALARTAAEAARGVHDRSVTAETLLDRAESSIAGLRRDAGRAVVSVGTSLRRVFPKLEALYNRQTDVTGKSTGLTDLDKKTAGLQDGDLVIVAGRPSMGKTSVVMGWAARIAKAGDPVVVFSLEMSTDSLTVRMLSAEARVDGHRLKTGRFLDSDWAKLARASDVIDRLPLEVDDTPGVSVLEVRAKARAVKKKYEGRLGLVVVDYLQLMRGTGREDNREQEISGISRGLKGLAKELGCPVVALSQLNRSVEKQKDRRPGLADLRESGAIEQDADLIVFVYRDEVYDKDSQDKGVAELIIGKQRNGDTGAVRVKFDKEFTLFRDLAEDHHNRGGYTADPEGT